MKTKHYAILGIALFLTILALTNPNQEIHKEKVKVKLNEFYEKEMAKNDNTSPNQFSQAGKSMGMILAKSMINMVIDNSISSSNYILFSTTDVTWEGKTKTVGIGVLGNVFLTSNIDDAIKK
ncbi:DUF4359 domain-containing protein [Flavobacterium sp. MMLR14_040]|uniref:DUF4359 domain-containing protein n=1 Tax=Flavobacterium sp. MMLR14_040 TaxID=3093843 RepID=UPI00298F5280|nr:DUF4359 domain-containing protein [Flavobacterium sp. MMLR14_040]MDW8850477.1 DUF4359 domain-containing protein [Flavobacterium sp. MMLR14_040]